MSTDRSVIAVPTSAWVAWVAICVIWGTTFLAIKVALETIPPFLISGFRYLIAGAVLTPLLLAGGATMIGLGIDRRQRARRLPEHGLTPVVGPTFAGVRFSGRF